MSAKFDEDIHNNLVAIVFTRIRRDARTNGRTDGCTDGTTAALLYPLRNALRGYNKMAAPSLIGYDYSTFPLKPLNGIQLKLTGSKITTSSTKFAFFGRSVNKNGHPGRSVKKVAHCTQVHVMWPFGPLVFFFISILIMTKLVEYSVEKGVNSAILQ